MPYAGQLAEIAAGVGTLTSDNNAARARHLDLIVAEGIVSRAGVWEREPGATPYYSQGLLPGVSVTTSTASPATGWAAAGGSWRVLGTPTFVAETGKEASVAPTTSATLVNNSGSQINSGATVIVGLMVTAPQTVTSVTDFNGNTWSLVVRSTGGALFNAEVWAVTVSASIPNLGIIGQFNLSGAASFLGQGYVFTGLSTLDKTVAGVGAGSNQSTNTSTPIATTESSELIFGVVGTIPDSTFTAGSGFTAIGKQTAPLFPTGSIFGEYRIVSPTSGAVAINAVCDFWPSVTTQRLLALGSDGILYKSSGAAFTPITMATTMADQRGAMIVVGGQEEAGRARKAFVFDNGVTKIQTLSGDGASTTNFGNNWNTTTNIPVDWATNPPRGGLIHKERLWCYAPANAPHNIYASKLRDHENFKNAVGGTLEYVQEIGTGTGLRIAALASFKGMLFAAKFPRGIYYLDDTDVDYLNWRWNLVTDSIGVADSPFSMIVLDEDVLIVGADGHLHFLSAITQQGILTSDLTAKFNLQQWVKDNINLNRLSQMTSTFYPAWKLAMIGVPSIASDTNDLRIFLDFSNATDEGQTVRISYSHRDDNRVLALRRDEQDNVQRPIFADSTGIIWKMDQDAKIKVGVPNAGLGGRFQYNPTDFSHIDPSLSNKRKLFDALTVIFNPVGDWDLSVDSIIDGDYQETLRFSMGSGASILGTFQFGDPLGGGSITTTRRRMTGHGYWLSLAGWAQGDAHDFSVAKLLVNMRLGGEEQR